MSAVAEKVAQHVLTSENAGAFYEQRLRQLSPEPIPSAPPEGVDGGKVESEKAPVEAPVVEAQPQKIEEDKHDFRVRFSTLTEQKKAAEAEAKQAREEAAREREARVQAEARAREVEAKLTPPPQEPKNEPKPEDYPGDPRKFAREWTAWADEQEARESYAQKVKQEAEKVISDFNARRKAFSETHPDFETKIATSQVKLNDPDGTVKRAIMESDKGPEILLHLHENPDLATKLQGMSPTRQVREIGFLEKHFAEPAAPKEPKAEAKPVAPVEISRAPEPITPLKGADGGGMESYMDAQGNFTGTPAQYRALRKAGKIK